MGVSVRNKHSTIQQKQERVLTVMPIDWSALHIVKETSCPIRFVCRQTRCNCKELQEKEKKKRTERVNQPPEHSLHAVAHRRRNKWERGESKTGERNEKNQEEK